MNRDLIGHLAPDSIRQLLGAAEGRFQAALALASNEQHRLTAVYLFGFSAEMWLAAACFRAAGFGLTDPIDRGARQRRMTFARLQQLMNSDPHPLVGWARYLLWLRDSDPNLPDQSRIRLQIAVKRADVIYRHWRPELRYKTIQVRPEQLEQVRFATEWLRRTSDSL